MVEPILETGPMRSEADRQLERELELLALWMDGVFRIPGVGIRFGLDSLIGLLPGVGDALTSIVSLYILSAASRFGIPRVTLARMAMNIAIDWMIGSVPLLGDVFDVYWKSNQRNVALLRRHVMAAPVEERRARTGDWLFVGGLIVALLVILTGCLAAVYAIFAAVARAIAAPH
jgi:hypothetical protein